MKIDSTMPFYRMVWKFNNSHCNHKFYYSELIYYINVLDIHEKKTKQNKAAPFHLSHFTRIYRKIKTNLIISTNRGCKNENKSSFAAAIAQKTLYWQTLSYDSSIFNAATENYTTILKVPDSHSMSALQLLCDRAEEVHEIFQDRRLKPSMLDSANIGDFTSLIFKSFTNAQKFWALTKLTSFFVCKFEQI